MGLSDYEELCRVCDEILLSKDSSVTTKAITWLHVLNAHPVNLEKYQCVFEFRKRDVALHVFLFVVRFLRNLFLMRPASAFFSSNNDESTADILIFSHLLNRDQLGLSTDFYYGDIASDIHEHRFKSQIVLFNHVGISAKKLADAWEKDLIPRVFLGIG